MWTVIFDPVFWGVCFVIWLVLTAIIRSFDLEDDRSDWERYEAVKKQSRKEKYDWLK